MPAPTHPPAPRAARPALRGPGRVLALALLAAVGCLPQGEPQPPPLDPAEAERALRAHGEGLFTVQSFQAAAGRTIRFENGQHYRYWLFSQPFQARLRLTADAHTRSLAEMEARQRDPAWSIAESEQDLMRLALLGAGDHRAGEEVAASTQAVFERYGAAWRFVAFDAAGLR